MHHSIIRDQVFTEEMNALLSKTLKLFSEISESLEEKSRDEIYKKFDKAKLDIIESLENQIVDMCERENADIKTYAENIHKNAIAFVVALIQGVRKENRLKDHITNYLLIILSHDTLQSLSLYAEQIFTDAEEKNL